jgi:hypothetical protein
VIDLHWPRPIRAVTVGCLQSQSSWIFFPTAIDVAVSEDGANFRAVGSVDAGKPKRDEGAGTRDLVVPVEPATARFVKIRVVNAGVCPSWHKGAGGKAWVFVDEIAID